MDFKLSAKFQPKGDQKQAIEKLSSGIKKGFKHQVLLGVTGSGKTFTMAGVIAKIQKPTLVIAHNKTLAAQLTQEFREFFPQNAVQYFVSYYDYYQPEAYLPTSDTYIEKEAMINEEIDRLRHAATQALLTRRDVIIVASVSCIYGLGSPAEYREVVLCLKTGQQISREAAMRQLVSMQFSRTNADLRRGTFKAKGPVLEIMPVDKEEIYRVELKANRIGAIRLIHPVSRKSQPINEVSIFPAKHYVVSPGRLDGAFQAIRQELDQRLKFFRREGKLLEAERLERRTNYDLELIKEIGYCNGIENYSRYFDGRAPGQPSYTLLDYFISNKLFTEQHLLFERSPAAAGRSRELSGFSTGAPAGWRGSESKDKNSDFLLFVDECHVTVPQIGGMFAGDRSRKETLIEYGFRLPSALDNRPLKFEEFSKRVSQAIYVSATPADWELKKSAQIAEQIVRPTGLVDPQVEVRSIAGQAENLIGEIQKQVAAGERTLVTTLTKKMAEDLAGYLKEQNIKVTYLHSDIKTIERVKILESLRAGKIDVLVGVNLLREGLDLPEVSLVAILDADKEGFLRSETSLVQTIGRAARNVSGRVILYADNITGSMRRAIAETNRRRKIQIQYNQKHGITPRTIQKAIKNIMQELQGRGRKNIDEIERFISQKDLPGLIRQKEAEMKQEAQNLHFEEAAILRDEIVELGKLNKKIPE